MSDVPTNDPRSTSGDGVPPTGKPVTPKVPRHLWVRCFHCSDPAEPDAVERPMNRDEPTTIPEPTPN